MIQSVGTQPFLIRSRVLPGLNAHAAPSQSLGRPQLVERRVERTLQHPSGEKRRHGAKRRRRHRSRRSWRRRRGERPCHEAMPWTGVKSEMFGYFWIRLDHVFDLTFLFFIDVSWCLQMFAWPTKERYMCVCVILCANTCVQKLESHHSLTEMTITTEDDTSCLSSLDPSGSLEWWIMVWLSTGESMVDNGWWWFPRRWFDGSHRHHTQRPAISIGTSMKKQIC